MQNTTILSLNLLSIFSTSSFYTINHRYTGILRTSIYNSHFSNIFTSVLSAYTKNHKSTISNSFFSHIQNTPLIFGSDDVETDCAIDSTKVVQQPVKDKNIKPTDFNGFENQRAFFIKNCGDTIEILYCTFQHCYSLNHPGGSLLIEQDCTAVLHSVLFSNSHTQSCRGGAVSVSLNEAKCNDDSGSNDDPQDQPITQLSVQYCCFYQCYPDNEDRLYGVAIYASSKTTVLYFASSVDCPSGNKPMARGAQFDITTEKVKSKNINITGGKSHYCAGIEYRSASQGFFKFQTITKIKECMFATAYTSVDIKGLEISYTNFDHNKIRKNDDTFGLDCALVHIRFNDIILDHFYFTNFEYDYIYPKLVSRGMYSNNQPHDLTIKLVDCFIDQTVETRFFDNNIITENLMSVENLMTATISQLKYSSECEGEIIITGTVTLEPVSEKVATPSIEFTFSDHFSNSVVFTKSSGFTESWVFGRTKKFTPSHTFTSSHAFTKSNEFSNSLKFSNSDVFSKSFAFTQSSPNLINDPPIVPPGDSKERSTNLGIAVGVPIGAAAAVALICVAAFFLYRKHKLGLMDHEDIELNESSNTTTTTINPLHSMANQEDDPFAVDFADDN